MSHLGHSLVGDTKYGTAKQNKDLPFKYQALCSYKLTFTFKTDAENLNYLNNKCFEIKDIPFLKWFYEGDF